MKKFIYSEINLDKYGSVQNFKQLLKLFNQLLLRTHGDVEEVFKWMETLQERGYISQDIDLQDFKDQLDEASYIENKNGSWNLADKGVQSLRKSSLNSLFKDFHNGDGKGEHKTHKGVGSSPEELPEKRPYRFGDDLENVDMTGSYWNAMKRSPLNSQQLEEEDLIIQERENNTSCATVLLLDVSHSMILYGEDRFTPAKQVALALTELITTRYKKDSLDIVLFGNEAIPVAIKDLPYASVGPFHTNTKAGLNYARKLLERRKSKIKQIIMVTDGKPTVIHLPSGEIYRNTFGLDPRIINRTLDEAVICRRRGIDITTFMVTRDPYLEDFVNKLTELNQGKAYFSSPDDLGGFVLKDFFRRRQSRA
jgi:Ca-activated chloride channel homolog